MPAVKIQRFLGIAPRVAPELLPETAAQVAANMKLSSGDMLSYRAPHDIADSPYVGGITRTLFGLRNPSDESDLKFVAWGSEVSIVRAVEAEEKTVGLRGRFYYTGDGAPKVSTYDMALDPNGLDYFDLGLPLPSGKPSASPTALSTYNTTKFERDAANTATITTSSAHGFVTGNVVSVTSFAVAGSTDQNKKDDATAKTFNVTNAEIEVTGSTTFTYFSPGEQISSTNNTTGRVTLAGQTRPRAYVFTWVTPWDEESIPSEPSTDVYVKEGQIVTVSSLPTTAPSGKNFIRGIRLYRTIVSVTGTDYFRLATLWFPTATAKVARDSNVSTVTLASPHNLIVDDRFKLKNCTDSSFNITGTVTAVVDRYTFRYAQSGSDTPETVDTTGVLCHDVAELSTDAARYWGDSSYQFVDDFNVKNLTIPLDSMDNDPPPAELQGLVAIQNNIFAGFVDNLVYFTEPSRPYAWPAKYVLTFDSAIVSIQPVAGYVVVLTETYPYRISGSDPAVMTYARVDTLYPCLSAASVVNMGWGIAYATHGGTAVYDPTRGAELVTRFIHDWDTWIAALDPRSIVAAFYNGKYFASHRQGGFIFERDEKVGGYFVTVRDRFDAAWCDPYDNKFYFVAGNPGVIREWDSPDEPLAPLDWKSKRIVTPAPMNLGAARVIADFAVTPEEIAAIDATNAAILLSNQTVFGGPGSLGATNDLLFNELQIDGSRGLQPLIPYPTSLPLKFRLWVNEVLVYDEVVHDRGIFRLPAGYRSDTFAVGISGSARVKAVHVGETPFGLRAI